MSYGTKEYWEKRCDKLEEELKGSQLRLFGRYDSSGVVIPLDDEIRKEISRHIKDTMYALLREDKDLEETFVKIAMNYRKAFVRIFKPIVKEMIEKLDFTVFFRSEGGEENG